MDNIIAVTKILKIKTDTNKCLRKTSLSVKLIRIVMRH